VSILEDLEGENLRFSEKESVKKELEELCFQADIDLFLNEDFCNEIKQVEYLLGSYSHFFLRKLQFFAIRIKGLPTPSIMESAPAVGLLIVKEETPLQWIQCGQLFEQIFLEVTRQGIKLKPYSVCLKGAQGKQAVASLFDVDAGIPTLLFCIGYPTT
jgi:hypothetical protein